MKNYRYCSLKKAKLFQYTNQLTPLIKKNNYRPISFLLAFLKLFERIMYNKVMSFLNSNNSIYKHQNGFREKQFTQLYIY